MTGECVVAAWRRAFGLDEAGSPLARLIAPIVTPDLYDNTLDDERPRTCVATRPVPARVRFPVVRRPPTRRY